MHDSWKAILFSLIPLIYERNYRYLTHLPSMRQLCKLWNVKACSLCELFNIYHINSENNIAQFTCKKMITKSYVLLHWMIQVCFTSKWKWKYSWTVFMSYFNVQSYRELLQSLLLRSWIHLFYDRFYITSSKSINLGCLTQIWWHSEDYAPSIYFAYVTDHSVNQNRRLIEKNLYCGINTIQIY